jgi:hypothetical protein
MGGYQSRARLRISDAGRCLENQAYIDRTDYYEHNAEPDTCRAIEQLLGVPISRAVYSG